jgi:hypothetical protein
VGPSHYAHYAHYACAKLFCDLTLNRPAVCACALTVLNNAVSCWLRLAF